MTPVVSMLPDGKLNDFPQKQLMLFEFVDESFVDCWHGQCPRSTCGNFDRNRAVRLHASFRTFNPQQDLDPNVPVHKQISAWQREMIQSVDTAIAQQWLHCRLWQICLTHGLISADASEAMFSPVFVLQCGQQARHYYHNAALASREAHGVGLIEKLYDIGLALLQAYRMPGVSEGLKVEIERSASDIVADCKSAPSGAQEFGDKLQALLADCCLNHTS